MINKRQGDGKKVDKIFDKHPKKIGKVNGQCQSLASFASWRQLVGDTLNLF